MKCRYCGEQLEKGIDVCKACGRINKSAFGSGKFNKKIIITAAAAVVAVIVALGTVLAITGRSDIDVRLIDEKTEEYLLVNVPYNHTFNIEITGHASGEEFAVYDIYGDKVATDNRMSGTKATIKAPKGGYEKGEIYILDLAEQGRFKDKAYSDAKKIMFVIERKEASVIEYKEGVVELKNKDASLQGDKLILDGEYAEGDIIVVDTDANKVDEIYKLVDVTADGDGTIASYAEPEAEEVYKELDVFYYDDVDFSEAEIDEEALIGVLDEMGVLDAFVDEVYAESDSDIDIKVTKAEWTKVDASYKFECEFEVPKNSGRTLTVTFSVADILLAKIDEDLAMVNNSLTITSGLEFEVEGKDKKTTESKIRQAIEEYTGNEAVETTEGDYDVPVIPVTVPIVGPVSAYVELGLTASAELSAEFNAGIETSVKFTQGIIYNIDELKVVKKYADVIGTAEAHVMVHGKLESFAGAYMDMGVKVPAIIEVGVEAKGGPYLDAEGCFSVEIKPDDIKSEGYYYIEIGIMFAADATIDVIGLDEKTIDLVESKKVLYKISEHLDLLGTNLADTYNVSDEGIDIGELEARYHDVISDKDITEPIEEYTLYINNKESDVIDGVVTKSLDPGKYNFKIKWKYDGDKFEEEKEVEITDFDPWGYFLKNHNIMMTSYEEIENKYGRLHMHENNLSTWGDFTYLGLTTQEGIYYYTNKDILFNFDDTGLYCVGIAGTAEQLFGIKTPVDMAEFEEKLMLDDSLVFEWATDVRDRNWYGIRRIGQYLVRISCYNDDVQGATPKPEYDPLMEGSKYPSKVTLNNIDIVYSGLRSDYRILAPSTHVSICMEEY